MTHGRQECCLRPISLIGTLFGDVQLVHELLTPGYHSLQVSNPGNRHQEQGRRNGKPLNNCRTITQPIAFNDGYVSAPTAGQLTHFSWGNAHERLAQNGVQLRIIAGCGKADLLGLCAYRAGDLQLFTKSPRDQIACTDQRTDRRISCAFCHHAQGRRRVVSLHHLNAGVVLLNKLAQHVAPHQCHPPARHFIQGFRHIRTNTGGQHKRRCEVRSGKAQLILSGSTARDPSQHVCLARTDQLNPLSHRALAHGFELKSCVCTDLG